MSTVPDRAAPPVPPSAQPTQAPSADAARLAADLLERSRSEIDRADSKASILMAGTLAGVGALVAVSSTTGLGRLSSVMTVVWWCGAITVGAGVLLLGGVLYPRLHPAPPSGRVGYFGDVIALGSEGALRRALLAPDGAAFEVTVEQLWRVSIIVQRKYRLMQAAMATLGAGFLLLVVASLSATW